MTGERDQLVHLAGYASITGVLATAEWAGVTAWFLALPIILGALYLGGTMFVRRLTARARRDLEEDRRPQTAATDGGVAPHDPAGDGPVEQSQTTTAGDRISPRNN